MGARRSGREAAIQMLYQSETGGAGASKAIELFWRHFEGEPESREYANRAVEGVLTELEEIDRRIREASEHWRIERMARVDLAILRLGTWELWRSPEVPRAVVLDEAVELAKAFGTDDSPSFVNGVLNKVADLVAKGA